MQGAGRGRYRRCCAVRARVLVLGGGRQAFTAGPRSLEHTKKKEK